MKIKALKWIFIMGILLTSFQLGLTVNADRNHDESEYEEHEKFFELHDEDDWRKEHDREHKKDVDYEGDEEYEQDDDWLLEDRKEHYTDMNQQFMWNIWTRDTNAGRKETLPIQTAKEVNISVDGKNEKIFVIPQYGQLIVPSEKIANLLDAETKFYPRSRILVVSKGDKELIVRAGSNAAYENMVKTPMPIKALYYEKSIYLPVSVIANSMGYRVHWKEEKETIVLEEII